MSSLLPTITSKEGVDEQILNCIDKLAKSVQEVSKFATIALVDVDAPSIEQYIRFFDITFIPTTIFFFNAEHLKMDSGIPDHTKWIGAFHCKQDFIDDVETIFRGAMKGKLIVPCSLPVEWIPKFELLYKEI